ncbi:gamma carbonic anhydrase family protein [Poseidonocella sp. HB161398]|uniref:gamma carbonic anhydrase family protein n=1 Tax=Poseidonocella sp. HB161398 TaxID=2320855 RepID=UPI001109B83F|nr:gamma carbonic anhydrase family protein [Poseidonocella sp. HB161398]
MSGGLLYSLGATAPRGPAEGEAWVAPTAVLIGDVRLAAEASIWFGAVLRADDGPIEIGAGSNIQDNCVLHVDPGFPIRIGADCTIGHRAMIHGCSIGEGTLIGMGATVLNGARIGKGCLIGAGALVTEGREIPDHSMVLGAPGKVVRELDEAAREGLRAGAALYRARWRRYRDELAGRRAPADGALGAVSA